MGFIKREFTTSQIYGSGLALLLILLLVYLFAENKAVIQIAVVLTVLLMVWPAPFRYFAILWFGLADVLGYVVSRIILTVVYLILVVPVGILKRESLRRSLKLNLFKKGNESVFTIRNHTFTGDDLLKPF